VAGHVILAPFRLPSHIRTFTSRSGLLTRLRRTGGRNEPRTSSLATDRLAAMRWVVQIALDTRIIFWV